jgi:hypothetical protein
MLLTSNPDLLFRIRMTMTSSDLLPQVLLKCHLLDLGAVLVP